MQRSLRRRFTLTDGELVVVQNGIVENFLALREEFDLDRALRGTLAGLDPWQIVIAVSNDTVGTVHVHFPRLGYRVLDALSQILVGRIVQAVDQAIVKVHV